MTTMFRRSLIRVACISVVLSATLAASVVWADEPATAFASKLSFVKSGGLLDVDGDVQQLHVQWHKYDELGSDAADVAYRFVGTDFLEFHRELLAQYDDFALSGPAVDAPVVTHQVAIPWVPEGKTGADGAAVPAGSKLYGMVRPTNDSFAGFSRDAYQNIYNDTDGNGMTVPINATGVPNIARDARMKLGNADFEMFDVDAFGRLIDSGSGATPILYDMPIFGPLPDGSTIQVGYHGLGHSLIFLHDRDGAGGTSDHTSPKYNVKDVSFYHWHKHLDNVYADWAVAKYRKGSGTPVFFTVDVGAQGAAGSKIAERDVADVYFAGSNEKPDGTPIARADQVSTYGAKPRIASDIYVGDNDDKNLVFHYGFRKWSDPVHTANPGGNANDPANPPVTVTQDATKFWNIDAYSDLNLDMQSGVFFSLAPGSMGKEGTTVRTHAAHVTGDIFRSNANGSNGLYRSEGKIGLAQTDNLDGLDVDFTRIMQATNDTEVATIHDRDRQFFSLKKDSINSQQAYKDATTVETVEPGDILNFAPDGRLTIAVQRDALGMSSPDDELDALFVLDMNKNHALNSGDKIFFSLAAGSPSLSCNCSGLGGSAADIFSHTLGTVGTTKFLTADQLGLLATDDVDALDFAVIPEPSACLLAMLASALSWFRGRRRR